MNGLKTLLPNAWFVAAREYKMRVGSRSFLIGTVILAAIAFAATEAPVLIDSVISSSQTKLAVVVEPAAQNMPSDIRPLFDQSLNGTTDGSGKKAAYVITWLAPADRPAADKSLEDGTYSALLVIDRQAIGVDSPLKFTLRSDMPSDGGTVRTIEAALRAVMIEDQLKPGASLSAPLPFTLEPINPSATPTHNVAHDISTNLLSTGLIVLIFMAIITYGTWVAMSVAEEKGSRVMELMLNAATPLQMLAGKVVGNGAAGITQYGAILVAAIVGVVSQDRVHELITGGKSDGSSFTGLTPAVLGGFIVLFVLGFAFYSLLYAGLGSLVSRQEDVQSATSPLMMLIMVGYFMSVFALQAINEPWVRILSFVPFFSPYLMLARIAVGEIAPWEFGLAVVILIASIGAALVVAARIYSAGVLLYGQRVGLREIFKAARVSR